jgi:hypothetical protein
MKSKNEIVIKFTELLKKYEYETNEHKKIEFHAKLSIMIWIFPELEHINYIDKED